MPAGFKAKAHGDVGVRVWKRFGEVHVYGIASGDERAIVPFWREKLFRQLGHRGGNPQQDLQDKGVIDSGCPMYKTGNMSYLIDYEEIDGGYVAFG
nr:ribonuclease H-like domain-containing protein [Tanacetum cinerariifolium]